MIDLYSWTTPNGDKIHIMLEETGLAYRALPINIGAGEQHRDTYRRVNPNGKIPALVDHDGPGGKEVVVFESGAILVYLAEKSGKFLPQDTQGRFEALQWVMFQMSGIGPMFGQLFHFKNAAPEQITYAIERYDNEVRRLLGVLERQLASREYLAGEYSIADMASYPWVRVYKAFGISEADFPNVQKWVDRVAARPAVQRGMGVLRDHKAT